MPLQIFEPALFRADQLKALTFKSKSFVPGLVCAIAAGSFYPGIAARTGMRRTFGVISLLGIGLGLVVSGSRVNSIFPSVRSHGLKEPGLSSDENLLHLSPQPRCSGKTAACAFISSLRTRGKHGNG